MRESKSKILVADDDGDYVSITSQLLEAHGYQVISAHEGLLAVEVALRENPDLILLDWKMPIGKGSAVLEMLQEKPETRRIPVIIATGTVEPGLQETAEAFGVVRIFHKPFNPVKLVEAIKETLHA